MDDLIELAKLALEAVKEGKALAFSLSLLVVAGVTVGVRRLLRRR